MSGDGESLAATPDAGGAARGVAGAIARALAPVVLALLAGAIVLLTLGVDPLAFYGNVVQRGLLSPLGLQATVTRMAPLLLLGASLIVAFRAGLWNLGVDGQFILGAVMTAALAPIFIQVMPNWLMVVLLLLIAAAVGALWSVIPALLKAYYAINEIVTTLMMSFLALSLANLLIKVLFRDPSSTAPETAVLPVSERLPRLFDTTIHVGVLFALAILLLVHFVMTRTPFGLRVQVVGANPRAAIHAGLDVPLLSLAVFAVSAGLAGLAGGVEILGVWGTMRADWNPAYGLMIVPLVFLARFNGFALIGFVAFFAVLSIGGETASRKAGIPNDFLLVLVALVLGFLALTDYLMLRWQQRRR
jgi:general nucleoside transport system permease protein